MSGIFLILNSQLSYILIWCSWYSGLRIRIMLGLLTILAVIVPLKSFISSTILLKKYGLISNNNSRELNDPKMMSELGLDLIYQASIFALLIMLALSFGRFFTAFMAIYWISLNNAFQKVLEYWRKFRQWNLLKNRINELYYPKISF
jgi:hypothetical protein